MIKCFKKVVWYLISVRSIFTEINVFLIETYILTGQTTFEPFILEDKNRDI